jgi:recombinational DNA repair protein RecR
MPIDYKEYHPKWNLISRLIRFHRAKNHCEWCGALNKNIIIRISKQEWRQATPAEIDMIFSRIKNKDSNLTESLKHYGFTKVVLTVAHLDHDKTNNRFSNLAALCQRCHLRHDLPHHIRNRKYGRHHKRNQLTINFPATSNK